MQRIQLMILLLYHKKNQRNRLANISKTKIKPKLKANLQTKKERDKIDLNKRNGNKQTTKKPRGILSSVKELI